MTVYNRQKDIYAISSLSIIFAAVKLCKLFLYFTVYPVQKYLEFCNRLWKTGILTEFCSKSVWEFCNLTTNSSIGTADQGTGAR